MTHDKLPHVHNDKGSGIICDCPKSMIEIKIPMTHDELLEKIEELAKEDGLLGGWTGVAWDALRAVVELHKPDERSDKYCRCEEIYPCPTIQAIEKELK